MTRFRAVIHRIRDPFLRGVLYGIGLSGGAVSLAVAGYNARVQPNWRSIAAVLFATILLAQMVSQIRRNATRGPEQ
jgi:hypothetical protein